MDFPQEGQNLDSDKNTPTDRFSLHGGPIRLMVVRRQRLFNETKIVALSCGFSHAVLTVFI